eukprot:299719_1
MNSCQFVLVYCLMQSTFCQLDCREKYYQAADTGTGNIALPQPSFSQNYLIITLNAASSPHIHISNYINPLFGPEAEYNLEIHYDYFNNDHRTAVRRNDGTGVYGYYTIWEQDQVIDLINGQKK